MKIDEVLEKWYSGKEKIKILEDKIEKYRKIITKELDSKGTNSLTENGYNVTRRKNTKTYVSKDSLPEEIWKKYCLRSNYDSLTIKKL